MFKKRNNKSPLLKTSTILQSSKSMTNCSLPGRTYPKKLFDSRTKYLSKDLRISSDNKEDSMTSRAAQMAEVLSRMETNGKLSKEELGKQLRSTLKMFFAEIISLDPHFGVILGKIKAAYEELDERHVNVQQFYAELQNLKAANADLVNEINEERKKTEGIEHANKSLMVANESLRRELSDLRAKLFTAKNQLTEAIETKIPQDVLNEIEDLYNEAHYLRKVNASLYSKLKQAQTRENALVALAQDRKTADEILERLDAKCNCMVEVGRRRVKVPVLDLSRVNCSVSSEESENSEYVHNKQLLSH